MNTVTGTSLDSRQAKNHLKRHIINQEAYINEPHRNLCYTEFQINYCLKLLAKLRALRKLS